MVAKATLPLLGLRMQPLRRVSHLAASLHSSSVDWDDRAKVLAQQDKKYKCGDYLGKMTLPPTYSDPSQAIDAICREKMCEWTYRVCDHFGMARQVVAFSFSILDRFLTRQSCDRTTYKLAAMTTFYMAAKMVHATRPLSIKSLAELSRGEFQACQIAELEQTILKQLDWKLNGPTAQCFLDLLFPVFLSKLSESHKMDMTISAALYERARFFCELALYDYAFCSANRSVVAIGSILNAMEGLDTDMASSMDAMELIQSFGCESVCTEDRIEMVRNRLWYVYSTSAQYAEDEFVAPSSPQADKKTMDSDKAQAMDTEEEDAEMGLSSSPVSVRQ